MSAPAHHAGRERAQAMKRSEDVAFRGRPLVALADEYPAGFVDPMHMHDRVQLLYACSGVMSIRTSEASMVIPPQRAVWLPAGLAHEVSCRGPVSLRTLYIDPSYESIYPGSRIIEVGDLLKALILEVGKFGEIYDQAGREGRIVELLISEIIAAPSAPYLAPMPLDPRLVRVCREILKDPADHRDIDDWAKVAGMSRRSFTRAFKKETGMGVALWRQQVRLQEAVSRLSTGSAVSMVAFDVGYDSPSAFCAMFQRAYGVPPSRHGFR